MSVQAAGPLIFLAVNLSLGVASPAETLENLTARASAFQTQGRYEEAELAYREALQAASDDLARARVGNRLAALYEREDRYGDAERMFQSVLRWREETLPATSPEIAYSLNNLAEVYHVEGRDWEARNLLATSVENLERFNNDAEGLRLILGNLAIVLCRFGELDRAEGLLRHSLELYKPSARESRSYAVALGDMAQVLELRHEFHAAAPLYREAIGILERLGPPTRVDLAATLADEGTLYQRMGQVEESLETELRALELLPASSNRTLRAQVLRNLGNLAAGGHHPSDSLTYFEESLMIQEQTLGAEHPGTAALLLDYSAATARAGNKSLSRKLRKRAIDLLDRIGSKSPEQMTVSLRDLRSAR